MSCLQSKLTLCLLALFLSNTFRIPLVQAQSPVLKEDSANAGIVQTPAAQDNQTSESVPPPKVELSRERTGVDPNKTLNLSLREAVTMALEHNLDIQVEKDNIKIAEYNLLAALGVYDIFTGAEFGYRRSTTPTFSRARSASGSIQEKSFTYNFNVGRQLSTGGSLRADFDNARRDTSDNFDVGGFNPIYSPRVTFSFRQPIMKNFRINDDERNIRLLKRRLDLSDLTFRQRLIDLIARAQAAYYDLIFALRNEEIQRESVELAAVQLHNNQIQVKVGTAAPIDVISAEAELERRKDQAIASLLTITQAENALKSLILDDPNSDYWNYRISPTEQVEFKPEPIDLPSAINIAIDRRPEVKQLELQGELNKIDLEYFKNQEKPQIDLAFSFSGQGLAGSQNFAPGQPPPAMRNPRDGGYFKALSNVFDSRTYQFGVTFSFPLRNRTAKANISRTLVENKQLDARKRQMVQGIIAEVRNAVQAVEAARQRVEAAKAAVQAAKAQLKGEEQKFAVGLSTNFFVLQRQNELSIARGNELRATTDFNKARADLLRVMANNLP
ncbi:MAG: TolC family protein [Acidobacteriota bacterium]